MIQITDLSPAYGVQHEGVDNPSNIPNARVKDIYRNTTTGELFVCYDDTLNQQQWIGSQGSLEILSPQHPDLVAMYTMDNINGSTLVDETSNSNDGTLVNSPTTTSGILGNAINCSAASSQYITANDFALANTQGTFVFWVNEDVYNTGNRHLVSRGASGLGGNSFAFRVASSGTLQFFFEEGAVNARLGASVETVSTGWNMIAMASTGTSYEMWLNGSPATVSMSSGSNDGYWFDDMGVEAPTEMSIGLLHGNSGNFYYNCCIDQFRYFDRALTTEEITTLYQEKVITAFDHPSLVAAYTMDNIIGGTTLVDETGNFDGTFINNPVSVSGAIGNALDFDGISGTGGDGVSVFTSSATQGAVSFWVAVKTSSIEEMFAKGTTLAESALVIQSGSTYGLRIVFQTNSSTFDVIQSTENFTRGSGVFHHVVVQSDGAELTAFVDGSEYTLTATIGSNTGQWFGSVAGSDQITLARSIYQFANSGGAVQLDQFRYFNRPLSTDEITTLYNEGL